jgi:ribonuclease HII
MVDAGEIDKINILQATMRAMHECVSSLVHHTSPHLTDTPSPDHVLVDGNRLPWGHAEGVRANGTTRAADPPQPAPFTAEAVIKGDGKVLAIAAASVIAKVTRDRIMRDLDVTYPGCVLTTRTHTCCCCGPTLIEFGTAAHLHS